jgi:WD40 repeat protein
VEIWSAFPFRRTRTIDTQHGEISALAFGDDPSEVITADREGRLVTWYATGGQRLIHQFTNPVHAFVRPRRTRAILVGTDDGTLWGISDTEQALTLIRGTATVTKMIVLPDNISVCVGYSDGKVFFVDTASWHYSELLQAAEGIRDIAVTSDNSILVIASNDNIIHLGTRSFNDLSNPERTWTTIVAKARKIAVTHDGVLIAACSDGTIWIYSSSKHTWACVPSGTSELVQLTLSDAETRAVLFAADGHVIVLDLEAVRHLQNI